MTLTEEIKNIIREMMKQEMDNFNEASKNGDAEETPAPVVYMTLEILLAKIIGLEKECKSKNTSLLDKACNWLEDKADGYTWYNEMEGESGMCSDFVSDFRKAMEEEL